MINDIMHLDLLFDLLFLQLLLDPLIDVLYFKDLHSNSDATLHWSEFKRIRQQIHDNLRVSSLVALNASQYLAILLLEAAEFTALVIQDLFDMDLLFVSEIRYRTD